MIGNVLIPWLLLFQGSDDEPTALERLTPDFYGAVGTAVEAEWKPAPGPAIVGKPLRVVLQVRGAANPTELVMPKSIFGEANGDRQVVAGATIIVSEAPPSFVEFAFELIPNVAGKQTLPSVKYVYFRPRFPEGRRFAAAYADPRSFNVVASEQAVPTPAVTLAPAVPPASILESGTAISTWPALLVPAATPWLFFIVQAIRRRLVPDAAGLAALRSSPVVRRAWRNLQRARSPEDVQSILMDWLKSGHGLPFAATTSAEAATAWLNAPTWREDAIEVIRDCEQARFSGSPVTTAQHLVDRARCLLIAAEGHR